MKKFLLMVWAWLKIISACIAGLIAIIGLRYITILTHTYTGKLPLLLQTLVWIVLIVGAIAIWVTWYLRNDK